MSVDPFSDAYEDKFRIGDKVYIQTNRGYPALQTEFRGNNHVPMTVHVLGIAQIREDFPALSHNKTVVDGYITSWDHKLVFADQLYRSVEEFESKNKVALLELARKQAEEAQEKRIKKYKEAKQVVTDFEAQFFAQLESEA